MTEGVSQVPVEYTKEDYLKAEKAQIRATNKLGTAEKVLKQAGRNYLTKESEKMKAGVAKARLMDSARDQAQAEDSKRAAEAAKTIRSPYMTTEPVAGMPQTETAMPPDQNPENIEVTANAVESQTVTVQNIGQMIASGRSKISDEQILVAMRTLPLAELQTYQLGSGSNLLHSAAIHDRVEVAKYLIDEVGLDINALGGGFFRLTPLMLAARGAKQDIFHFLLSRGARVDIKDRKGRTASYWASQDNKRRRLQSQEISGRDGI